MDVLCRSSSPPFGTRTSIAALHRCPRTLGGGKLAYCWWFRTRAITSWCGKYLVIYRDLFIQYIPSGAGCLPSIVAAIAMENPPFWMVFTREDRGFFQGDLLVYQGVYNWNVFTLNRNGTMIRLRLRMASCLWSGIRCPSKAVTYVAGGLRASMSQTGQSNLMNWHNSFERNHSPPAHQNPYYKILPSYLFDMLPTNFIFGRWHISSHTFVDFWK